MLHTKSSVHNAQLINNATNNSSSFKFTPKQCDIFSKILIDTITLKKISKLIAINPINGIDTISLLLNVELGSKLYHKFNNVFTNHYFQVTSYAVPTIIDEIQTLFINANSCKIPPTKFTHPNKKKIKTKNTRLNL